MVAKILSLLNPLIKTSRSRLFKCVSPLLMGAVLVIGVMEPLNVLATETDYTMSFRIFNADDPIIPEGTTYSKSFYYYPNSTEITEQSFSDGSMWYYFSFSYDIYVPVEIYAKLLGQSGFWDIQYQIRFTPSYSFYLDNSNYSVYEQSCSFIGVEGLNSESGKNLRKVDNTGQYRFSEQISSRYFYSPSVGANSYISNYFLKLTANFTGLSRNAYPDPNLDIYLNNCSIVLNSKRLLESGTTQEVLREIEENTDKGNDILTDHWDQDQSDAEQAGSDMTGFASQLDNLKNTWAILWYPIEFTNRFVEVFTGGTQAAAYQDEYTYVSGYRYNDETGFLEPIMARSAQPQSAGTGITFPSFELMGYTVWDSYTYDLSQVKQQLPAVFDAIYVLVSILEVLWFVGFLRSKYNEVFG